MATTTAKVADLRKENVIKRWNGRSRKKREAQAEPTFFDSPADPSLRAGNAKGAREAAMFRENPDWESSEVARFRWESG